MNTLYMMVALPRSGKSSYVQEHFQGTVKVSADQLRLLIHGKRFWQEGEREVWATRKVMLRALLEQGIDVVIDETNVTRKSRKEMLQLAQDYGYTSIAVVVQTSPEICKERAIQSNQEDLIPVIENMAENYQEVTLQEGFSQIIYLSGE